MPKKVIYILLFIAALSVAGVVAYYLSVEKHKETSEFVPGGGDFRGGKGATGSW